MHPVRVAFGSFPYLVLIAADAGKDDDVLLAALERVHARHLNAHTHQEKRGRAVIEQNRLTLLVKCNHRGKQCENCGEQCKNPVCLFRTLSASKMCVL